MKAIIAATSSKGQFVIPAEMRREMGLSPGGDSVKVIFDHIHKRLMIEKAPDIDEVIAMNRNILRQRGVGAVNYQSGDGFKIHIAKKYGLSSK